MGGVSKHLVQVAAVATEVALQDGKAPSRIKLLPMGRIEMRDGRGPYRLRDQAHADQVVAATRAFFGSADMPGDRDHQIAFAVKPGVGGTAPATAWVKTANLSAEADGIYANQVEWTPAAAAQLEAREYRYISPLFMARRAEDGGDVVSLKNFALVNIGAIDLPAIAAGFSGEDEDMTIALIAAALGLTAEATAAQCVESIQALQKPSTSTIAIAAGLAETAGVEEIAAAVTTLKSAKAPDMSGFVPMSVVTPMKDQLAKLNRDRLEKQVDHLIAAGIVIPAKRDATLDWYVENEVAAAAFFKDMPPLVEPGTKLGDRQPGTKFTTLTAEEVAACAVTGMSQEDFLKAKNEEIA